MSGLSNCREHEHFILLCLRLLSTHLSLALAGGGAGSVLGNQARPLRNLLFRLVDTTMPQSVHNVRILRKTTSDMCHEKTDLKIFVVAIFGMTLTF